MTGSFQTISPVDGSIVFERALDGAEEIERTLAAADKAFDSWRLHDGSSLRGARRA
jgi:acyl-CoA reductase-like NAD-dependent aldehyde dehydrogenase